jgi:iron-sulfur cluster assembly protein
VNPTIDDVAEMHGIKVAIDRKSSMYLNGTEVDFYDGLEKRGFTFNNPNATKSCGCGTSFQV